MPPPLHPRTRVHVSGHALSRWQERTGQSDATAADVERSLRAATLTYYGREVGFLVNLCRFTNHADGVTFGVDWSKIHRHATVRTVLCADSPTRPRSSLC